MNSDAAESPGFREQMREARRTLSVDGPLVVLSGAGMSAESGVPTFRDAQTGLWAHADPADLATPEAWQRDRARVWAWYRWREHLISESRPNPGHLAIAHAQQLRDVVVVTQNVDDLHERAGSEPVHHVHGSLFAHRCDTCGAPMDPGPPPTDPVDALSPPACTQGDGWARPGVVWFGETLPAAPWDAAVAAVTSAAAVLVVGTSGLVYPAASLPGMAAASGTPVVEVNPGQSGPGITASVHLRAPAGQVLPELLTL